MNRILGAIERFVDWAEKRDLKRFVNFKTGGGILGIMILVLPLWYGVGMAMQYRIDDRIDWQPSGETYVEGGSNLVNVVAGLMHREIEEHGWVANNPFWSPISLSDNMTNYQVAIGYSASRVTIELLDRLGRNRGSSNSDPNLETAAGRFKYAPDVWVWQPSVSLMPQATTEAQYRDGIKALVKYNKELVNRNAVYDVRADNVIDVLDRIGSDLGALSAALDERTLSSNAAWFDTEADDVFYTTKGRMYGYLMMLRALQIDANEVIQSKGVAAVYQQMLDNLTQGVLMEPLVVSNGASGSMFMPSHLAEQGFYLLRARTQLKEVIAVLVR